jgi:hypothetical protein
MNFNPIAKWVTNEKALPRCCSSIVSLYIGRLQFGPQSVHVRAFETKMPLRVRAVATFLNRNMHIKPACTEPHTAATANRLRFRYLAQTQQPAIEGASYVLATFWHCHVDVGKAHS